MFATVIAFPIDRPVRVTFQDALQPAAIVPFPTDPTSLLHPRNAAKLTAWAAAARRYALVLEDDAAPHAGHYARVGRLPSGAEYVSLSRLDA